jgi:predicted ATPase
MIVITGGPSVGKSTLLNELRKIGFTVVSEQATEVIKEGKILPWENRDAFQREVLRRQIEAEAPFHNSKQTLFVDRCVFDGESYYQCGGIEPPSVFQELSAMQYSKVLLLEPLGVFVHDRIRFEDMEFTVRIIQVLRDVYYEKGFDVNSIPAETKTRRMQLALSSICEPLCAPSFVAGRK